MNRTLVAAACVALSVMVTGCAGDGEATDQPSPSPSSSSSTPPEPTTDPSSTGDTYPTDWEANFSGSDLDAARDALSRWSEYRELSAEIYRKGRLTPGAKATLQDYDFWWQRDIVKLGETYDKGGLRRASDVESLWAFVKRVDVADGGDTGDIVIVDCTDYRPLRYTRNGEPFEVDKPKNLVTTLLVTMTKPDSEHDWMYYEAKVEDETACTA